MNRKKQKFTPAKVVRRPKVSLPTLYYPGTVAEVRFKDSVAFYLACLYQGLSAMQPQCRQFIPAGARLSPDIDDLRFSTSYGSAEGTHYVFWQTDSPLAYRIWQHHFCFEIWNPENQPEGNVRIAHGCVLYQTIGSEYFGIKGQRFLLSPSITVALIPTFRVTGNVPPSGIPFGETTTWPLSVNDEKVAPKTCCTQALPPGHAFTKHIRHTCSMGSTLKELFLDSVKALKPPPPGVYLHQLWPADIARLADVDSIPGIRRLRESPGWSKSGEAKIVSLAGIQRQTSFDTIGSVIRRVRNGELEVFPITGKPTLHEDEVCICRFSLRSLEDAIAFSRVIEHIEKAAELEKANREQYLKEGDKAISVAS